MRMLCLDWTATRNSRNPTNHLEWSCDWTLLDDCAAWIQMDATTVLGLDLASTAVLILRTTDKKQAVKDRVFPLCTLNIPHLLDR